MFYMSRLHVYSCMFRATHLLRGDEGRPALIDVLLIHLVRHQQHAGSVNKIAGGGEKGL